MCLNGSNKNFLIFTGEGIITRIRGLDTRAIRAIRAIKGIPDGIAIFVCKQIVILSADADIRGLRVR